MGREGFYAVAHGRRNGVFSSWGEAEALVKGFRGAVFKKFSSHAEALTFVAAKRSLSVAGGGDGAGGASTNSLAAPHHHSLGETGSAAGQDMPRKHARSEDAVASAAELPTAKRTQSQQQPPAFYAVAEGRDTGVVTSWPQVLALTDGFPQPVFRKFETREAAQAFLTGYAVQQTKRRPSSDVSAFSALSTASGAANSSITGSRTALISEYVETVDSNGNTASTGSVAGLTPDTNQTSATTTDSPPAPTRFWYAVARGRETGVFETWNEAKKHVEGLFSASFKKFPSREAAEAFVQQHQENTKSTSMDPNPEHADTLVAFCDGSALQNGRRDCQAGFACVFPHCTSWNVAKKLLEPRATNNRAEYFAALEAMKRANVEDATQTRVLFIFSDSMLLIRSMTEWIGTWRRNHWCKANGAPVLNRDILEQLVAAQGERRVVWRHVKAHTGKKDWRSKWNDVADRAARGAAGS